MRFLPLLPRITPSFLVAALALVIACAGSATAAVVITGKQIKNNTVTHRDIKDGTLRTSDLAAKTAASLAGPVGPTGAVGPQGPAGATGPTGPPGPAGLTDWSYSTDGVAVAQNQTGEVNLGCPAGSKLLSATGYWGFTGEPAAAIPMGPTSARVFGRTTIADNLIGYIVCAKAL